MSVKEFPVAVVASEATLRTKPSNYPEPFASRMAGREKRRSVMCSACLTLESI